MRATIFALMASLAFVPTMLRLFIHCLDEMILQGGKYHAVAGLLHLSCAFFYAVCNCCSRIQGDLVLTILSPKGQRSWVQEDLTFGVIRISSSILRGFLGSQPHIYGFFQALEYQKEVGRC